MSMSFNNFRRSQTDSSLLSMNPLRQNSTASTNSSAYTSYSNSYGVSRTPTASSAASSICSQSAAGHKRGISEATGMAPSTNYNPRSPRKGLQPSPEDLYQSSRQSLRPLPQPPSSTPVAKRQVSSHNRSHTLDRFPQTQSEDTYKSSEYVHHPQEDLPIRSHIHHARTNPHSSPIVTPDLQELQKSTTGHLRALSKFANAGSDDFSISSPTPSVVGLAGRRQLKRTDSTSGARGKPGVGIGSWGDRNWMDKQRQFLQAYEYLCHIGEAKEWIEDIIHQPIPPIVQLEEALRDGVTLAEIVQAFHPEGPLRIFRNAKLQFRHSDNIVTFFRFLEDVGLPDLFRFELIDLYEKKNIPKVIYCIHALSWLLYRKGLVDFRIGNLVGQLQFEHHELEQTQMGLDKAGVSMPSFKGMGESFGAEPEPEPEPVETEEERVQRELGANSASIIELQGQMRGALIRMRLGERMNDLWDAEELLIDLQSRIRGDWARQIIEYRLTMNRFATNLQSATRGFLVRSRQQLKEERWKAQEVHILKLQNLLRGRRAREEVKHLKSQTKEADSGIRQLQAAIRGALARRDVFDQYEAAREADSEIEQLQAAIKGMLVRSRHAQRQKRMEMNASRFAHLQSIIRANEIRTDYASLRAALRKEMPAITSLQSAIRGANAREQHNALLLALLRQSQSLKPLQAASRAFMLRQRQQYEHRQLAQHIPMVSELQALGRGALLRLKIGEDLSAVEAVEHEIAELQALARGLLLRSEVARVLAELDEHEAAIIELQSIIRAGAVRRRFEEKQRFFKENMEKVVKIQSVIRAKIQGQAYKSLTVGKNPPVGTLKGFVHLLNDSDFDFDEEIEFERLRKTVVQHVRQNELADQYINQLDVKIALLVKNKITLDEVVKHQRHFGGSVGSLLPNADLASKDPFDLKALNKASRKKLEQYQELFFLLQTQPQYLARLFRRMRENGSSEKENERIKYLVMGVFGYAQKRREEYYLVKLVSRSIKEEVDAGASLQDYLRTNVFSNKLFAAYTKSPRDRKFMRDVLGGLVKEHFVNNRALDLESDPLQIYRTAINNEELRTGQKSRRNPNVPREEAIRDPETRATFIHHMQDLRDIADQFFLCLEESLPRMPFGVRYVAQQTYEHLSTVFHYEDPAFVLSMVGQWMWKNYLQPALMEPEKYGVADRAMQQDQKRNLGEVAKVLGQAVTGREFGGENVYLQPLNTWVKESVCRFHDIWHHLISIPPAEEHYDIDEFNDLYAKTKPTLYIKMSDIFSIHQLLTSEIATICPTQDDTLGEVLRELGNAKSNESELMGVSQSEISLTLNPKLHNSEDPDAEVKALMTETKRCCLYIIRVQSGTSLLDILVKPIMLEDEEKWSVLVRDELSANSKRRGAYAEASTLIDLSTLSYHDLKSIALENILHLESLHRLTRTNKYQDLLNNIAVDIRTKHRRRIQRQRELENVRTTLARLNEQAVYLEGQLKTYNDYIEQAMVTLQSKKGKKKFVMPFTKQWDHERELKATGRAFKFGSYKYSARTLADKGVLVQWKGYSDRQWDRIDLTISSNDVGVFTIDGSSGNMMIPGAEAQVPLDDLLQAQFNNSQWIEFFGNKGDGGGGDLRLNVNLFLHLIMKKFYNE